MVPVSTLDGYVLEYCTVGSTGTDVQYSVNREVLRPSYPLVTVNYCLLELLYFGFILISLLECKYRIPSSFSLIEGRLG